MEFSFTVDTFPKKKLIGQKIRTSMSKAGEECPALWMTFAPRIAGELCKAKLIEGAEATYGVSRMIDDQLFDYWALIETQTDDLTLLPQDMETFIIEEGLYLSTEAASLEQLGFAYHALYEKWPQTQSEYKLDMSGISFERYPDLWTPADPFRIYASVLKNS